MSYVLRALIVLIGFGSLAHADGYISLGSGQMTIVDGYTLQQYGGRVNVSCEGYNPGPGPGGPGPGPYPGPGPGGPGPGPRPRDCNRYQWAYVINPYQTSDYTCTANGLQVGMQRSCQQDNVCGSEGAIRSLCYQRCQAGEFDGVLPRRPW